METIISWAATLLPNQVIVPGYTFNAWWGCFKTSPGCKAAPRPEASVPAAVGVSKQLDFLSMVKEIA